MVNKSGSPRRIDIKDCLGCSRSFVFAWIEISCYQMLRVMSYRAFKNFKKTDHETELQHVSSGQGLSAWDCVHK